MVANIRGYTPNYAFKLVNFDTPRWHTLEYANWTQLDGMLLQAGIPGIRGEWTYSTLYLVGDRVYDSTTNILYRCLVEHTSAATGTFEADRIAHPTFWTIQTLGVPVFRGVWQPNATYSLGDIIVVNTYTYYLCITNHTSPPAFVADATKWTLVFDATAAVNSTNASATAASGSATQAATSATNAATSATNAQASAVESAAQAQKLFGTSTSSNTVGLGAKTFITQASKYFNVGKFISVRANLDPINNWMWGQVSSYAGTSLVINAITSGGAGTFVDWIIDVSGSRGAIGPQGIQGELGPPLVIKGTVPSAGALPPTGNTIGDMWIATDNQHLYIWDGAQWDDAGPLGTSTTTTADNPPSNPKDGDMWWESDSGIFWVYYDDGNTSQWVQAGGAAASINQNAVLKTGDTMTGDLTISKVTPALILKKPDNISSAFVASVVGNNPRWATYYGASGPDDFAIGRFSDAGAELDRPLTISRATGLTTLTGDLTITKVGPQFILNKTTDVNAEIIGQKNGASRWGITLANSSPESGGDTGSDFVIRRYNDAGVAAPAFSINRVLNVVSVAATQQMTIASTTPSTSPTTGALTVAGGLGVGGAINAAGDVAISKAQPTLTINSTNAVNDADIYLSAGGAPRWLIRSGAEASDAAKFRLIGFNNAGAVSSVPLAIDRLTGRIDMPGPIVMSNGTASTSTTTGALTVAGGLGVGGTIHAGGYRSIGGVGAVLPSGFSMMGIGAADIWAMIIRNGGVTGYCLAFDNSSGIGVGAITTNASSTNYATASDASLKEDLKSFDAGNIIDSTNVYDFAWRSTKERAYGVIAQQAYDVYPQAVTHTEASLEKGAERDEWWGIDYSKYVPVLLQELKALRERVAVLEGRTPEKPTITPKRGRS